MMKRSDRLRLEAQARRERARGTRQPVAEIPPPVGVGGAAPRQPYDTTNRPRRTAKASGARGDYDSARWKSESKAYLERNPLCACGCGRKANIVDHVEPVQASGDPRFFDQSNWQGLARFPCHQQKSADDRAKAAGRKPRPITIRGCDAEGNPRDPRHWWSKG